MGEWRPASWDELLTPPVARCGRCGRQEWSTEVIGEVDQMTAPDGGICGGVFHALA